MNIYPTLGSPSSASQLTRVTLRTRHNTLDNISVIRWLRLPVNIWRNIQCCGKFILLFAGHNAVSRVEERVLEYSGLILNHIVSVLFSRHHMLPLVLFYDSPVAN